MSTKLYNINISSWNNAIISKWNNFSFISTIIATITPSSYNGYGTSCNGGSNGTLTVSAISGGSGTGFQLKLQSGGTYTAWGNPSVYSTLSAGSYTIYVKDSLGEENTFAATITQPSAQTVSITNPVNTTGGLSNGSLTITTTGGVFNKTYYLYRDVTNPYENTGGTLYATYSNVTSGSPSINVSSLPGGGYYVISTDANGCSTTSSVTIIT